MGSGFRFAGDVAGAALGFGHGVIPFVGKMPRGACWADGVRARGNAIRLIIGKLGPSAGWAEGRYLVDLEVFRKFRSLVTGMGEVVQVGGDFGIDAVDCRKGKWKAIRRASRRSRRCSVRRAVLEVALAIWGSCSMVSLREAGLPRASQNVAFRPVRIEATRAEGDRVGGMRTDRVGLIVGSG
jgi:hypothetical protein